LNPSQILTVPNPKSVYRISYFTFKVDIEETPKSIQKVLEVPKCREALVEKNEGFDKTKKDGS